MKIGFIGFGEAAFNIAFGLGNEGIRGIKAFDSMQNDPVMGQLVHSRAEESGVELVDSLTELIRSSEIIFSAIPSSFAVDVCTEAAPVLKKGQIYVDVSASTPAAKVKMWELLKGTGVLFADAAMLGSLPKDKHKVPITASGNGAVYFKELMEPFHMNITLAGEEAGSASAIKLVRSIFMKGIASLMIEMLQGATQYGVQDEVIASISKSLDNIPFINHLNRLVTGSAIHCKRRAAELKGSVCMLEEAGLEAEMTKATKHVLEQLESFDFPARYVDHKPAGWEEIIAVINQK